jgi:hypothetical protein
MKKFGFLLVLGASLSSLNTFGYGTGISTFPLQEQQKFISAEFTGITSSGGGLGLQSRFTQRINEQSVVDAGLGIGGGERSARLFAGYDYAILPDYDYQPKTSIKAFVENAKEFGVRRNVLGIAPTFSKGLSVYEKEIYPFLSLPFGISLNNKNNTYNSSFSANLGVSAQIPTENSKTLTASAEAVIGIKDSFSGVFVSVGYPIE